MHRSSTTTKPSFIYFVLAVFVVITLGIVILPDVIFGKSIDVPQNNNGLRRCMYDTTDDTAPYPDPFVEKSIVGNCTTATQDPFVPDTSFSGWKAVQWKGYIYAPDTGDYTFQITYNGGARLWIDDTVLINGWNDNSTGNTKDGTVSLDAGVWYSFVLEYYNSAYTPNLTITWDTPSTPGLVSIPNDHLAVDIPTHQSYSYREDDTLKEPFNLPVTGVNDIYVASINGGDDYITASNTGEIVWYDDNKSYSTSTDTITTTFKADSMYAVDLDDDDDNDVLAASQDERKVFWWSHWEKKQENGTKTQEFTSTLVAEGFPAFFVRAGDMNTDGQVDIVAVANDTTYLPCNENNPQPIVFWRNKGSKDSNGVQEFDQEKTFIGCGSGQGNIVIADINNDGRQDVVGTRKDPNDGILKVTWWQQEENGGFTAKPLFLAVDSLSYVAVGDINNDGSADDIVQASDNVRWYKNNGSGSFTGPYLVDDMFSDASAVFAGDVDKDGKDDIIASDGGGTGKALVWWENVGNNTFVKHTIIEPTDFAQKIAVYDRVGDSDLDVVGIGNNTLTWWKNDLRSKRISIKGPDPVDTQWSTYAYEYNDKEFAHVWDTSIFTGTIKPVDPIWPSEPTGFTTTYTWDIAGQEYTQAAKDSLTDVLTMDGNWHDLGFAPGYKTIKLEATNPYNPEGYTEGSKNIPVADYTFKDSTQKDGPEYRWVEIADTGTALDFAGGDNVEIPLPFAFWFYGKEYDTIKVSVDGGIIVGSGRPDVATDNTSLKPSPDNPNLNYLIAPYWDKLQLGTTGKVYVEEKTAPRRFVIQWDNMEHVNSLPQGNTATFQVVLYDQERTHSIKVQYQDVGFGSLALDNGGNATVGIRGMSETFLQEYSYCYGDTSACSDSRPAQWKSICFYRYPGLQDCDDIIAPSGVTLEVLSPQRCNIHFDEDITLRATVTNPDEVSVPLKFTWSVGDSQIITSILSTTDYFSFKWPSNDIRQQTVQVTVSNPASGDNPVSGTTVVNRSAVRFTTLDYTVGEQYDTAIISTTVNPPCPYDAEVWFTTEDGEATKYNSEDGTGDYRAKNHLLPIPKNSLGETVEVEIINDGLDGTVDSGDRDKENVALHLTPYSNIWVANQNDVIIDEATANLWIQDDEGPYYASMTIDAFSREMKMQSIDESGCGMEMTFQPYTVSTKTTVVYSRTNEPTHQTTDIVVCSFEIQAKEADGLDPAVAMLQTEPNNDTVFQNPVAMKINYTDEQLRNIGVNTTKSLHPKRWNSDQGMWELFSPPNLDTDAKSISFSYDALGEYMLASTPIPRVTFDSGKENPLRFEVKEGDTIDITPLLDREPWCDVFVTVKTILLTENPPDAAKETEDFSPINLDRTFKFSKTEPNEKVFVQTTPNDICEKDEWFQVTVTQDKDKESCFDPEINDSSTANVYIKDDDCNATIVKLEQPIQTTYSEGDSDIIPLTIVREGKLDTETTVGWVLEGSARPGIDYTVDSTSPVTFAPNDYEQIVPIRLLQDTEVDGDVSLTLKLTTVDPDKEVSKMYPISVTLVIEDDDKDNEDKAPYGILRFEKDVYTMVEGDVGDQSTEVCVVREPEGKNSSITAKVSLVDEAGNVAADGITIRKDTITFDRTTGDKQCFAIQITPDMIAEGHRDYTLRLTDVRDNVGKIVENGVGVQGTATFIIQDNDSYTNDQGKQIGQAQFVQTTYYEDEPDGNDEKTVFVDLERVRGSTGELTVCVTLHNDSAIAGRDYEYQPPQCVTFAEREGEEEEEGQTTQSFSIKLLPDTKSTGSKTLQLELRTEKPEDDQQVIGTRNFAELIILDNDTDPNKTTVYFPETNVRYAEGSEQVLIPVYRNRSVDPLTISYKSLTIYGLGNRAVAGVDYTLDSDMTITFDGGEKVAYIPVTIKTNTSEDGDKTFRITLDNDDDKIIIGEQHEVIVTIAETSPLPPGTNIIQFEQEFRQVDQRDGYVLVYIERIGDMREDITFEWNVMQSSEDGHYDTTAEEGEDYIVPQSNTGTIESGTSRYPIWIRLPDGNTTIGPREIVLKLTDITTDDASIGEQSETVITIQGKPNEQGAVFYIEKAFYAGTEPKGAGENGYLDEPITIICEGDGCKENGVSIHVSVAPEVSDTATEGVDYTFEDQTLNGSNFKEDGNHRYRYTLGEDKRFRINYDEDTEGREYTTLKLTEPKGAARLADYQTNAWIEIQDSVNEDSCDVYFPNRLFAVDEADKKLLNILAIRDNPNGDMEVQVKTAPIVPEEAKKGEDYIDFSNGFCTLKFEHGRSNSENKCELDIVSDEIPEGEEQFKLLMVNSKCQTTNCCTPEYLGESPVIIRDNPANGIAVYFEKVLYRVKESEEIAFINVIHSGNPQDTVKFHLKTEDDSATEEDGDYKGIDGNFNFDGKTTYKVPITITNDTKTEYFETLNLKITDVSGDKVEVGTRSEAVLIIEDDIDYDDPNFTPVVILSPPYEYRIHEPMEGEITFDVPMLRIGKLDTDIKVQCIAEQMGSSIEKGIAIAGTDFISATTPVTIPGDDENSSLAMSEANCPVTILSDGAFEIDEIFSIRIFTDTTGVSNNSQPEFRLGSGGQIEGTGIIINSDTADRCVIGFDKDDISVEEPESASNTIAIPISIDGTGDTVGCTEDITISISDNPIQAIKDKDYEFSSNDITIKAGTSEKIVDLTINSDEEPEDDEDIYFFLTISDTDNAILGQYKMVVTINANGNPRVAFANTDIEVGEYQSQVSMLVDHTPAPALGEYFEVRYEVHNDTAMCDIDYHIPTNNCTQGAYAYTNIITFTKYDSRQYIPINIGSKDIDTTNDITETKRFSISLHPIEGESAPPTWKGNLTQVDTTPAIVSLIDEDKPPKTVHIEANPTTLFCHPDLSSTLSLHALDKDGHNVKNHTVYLTTTIGTFVKGTNMQKQNVTTDSNGRATAELFYYDDACDQTALVSTQPETVLTSVEEFFTSVNTATIAFANNKSWLPLVYRLVSKPYPVVMNLDANPQYVQSSPGSTSISVKLISPAGPNPFLPVANQVITFTVDYMGFAGTDGKTNSITRTTNKNGEIPQDNNLLLYGKGEPGIVTVHAEINNTDYVGINSMQVYFLSDTPLDLQVGPEITTSYEDTVDVKIFEGDTLITIPTDIDLNPQDPSIVQVQDETGVTANGMFETTLTCKKNGQTTIEVQALQVEGENAFATEEISVNCISGTPYALVLESESHTQKQDGSYKVDVNNQPITFKATLKDKKGTLLSDKNLTFSAHSDFPIAPLEATTNYSGVVEGITLSNPKLQVKKVLIGAETKEGTLIGDYIWVNYSAPICSNDDTPTSDNDTRRYASQLHKDFVCQGSFDKPIGDDIDFFAIEVNPGDSSTGQTFPVTIKLDNMPLGADYDLSLWTSDSRRPLVQNNKFNNEPETIKTNLEAGTYYARVKLQNRANGENTYTISYQVSE